MAKSTNVAVTLPGVTNRGASGSAIAAFQKGTDVYEKLETGAPVDITFEGGETITGTVTGLQVGALIDLVAAYGQNNFYTYGDPYSPRALVSRIGQGEVVDVTKLWTVVQVSVSPPMTGTPMPRVA